MKCPNCGSERFHLHRLSAEHHLETWEAGEVDGVVTEVVIMRVESGEGVESYPPFLECGGCSAEYPMEGDVVPEVLRDEGEG